MRISMIEFSNFHGQTKRVDIDTNLVYLCGNNGRGKSTILQAAQLALLGYIPGYGKKVSDIFRHATDRQMSVSVTFDTGESIERTYTKTSKSIDTEVICHPSTFDVKSVVGNIELPIFNLSSLIDMTANQLKAWFINTLFTSDSNINWEAELIKARPEGVTDVENIKSEILDYINQHTLTSLDSVATVNAFIKSLKSEKNGELTRLSSTLQTLVYYDDVPTDATVNDIRAKYDRIKDIHKQILDVEANKETIVRFSRKLNEDCAEVIETNATVYKKQLDNMIDENNELLKVINDLEAQMKDVEKEIGIQSGILSRLNTLDGMCPITGDFCDKVKSDDSEVKRIQHTLEELRNKLTSLTTKFTGFKEDYEEASCAIEHRQKKWQLYLDCIAQLEAVDTSKSPANLDTSYTIEDCIALENKCIEDIQHITANETYANMHDNVLSEKYAVETSIEILKAYEKLTGPNGLPSRMNVSKFAEFAGNISFILHEITGHTAEIVFEISESANSFSFGYTTEDGKYVPYEMMSSGEKCIFNIALMISILDRLNTPIKLILADDIFDHLDEENIDKLFSYVYNNNKVQFIFAGVNAISKAYRESVIRL